MKHYDLRHFEMEEPREAVDWLSFLALVLFVSCVFVWGAILS